MLESYSSLNSSYKELQTVYQSHQEAYALLKKSNDKTLQAVILLMEKVDSISTASATEPEEKETMAASLEYTGGESCSCS